MDKSAIQAIAAETADASPAAAQLGAAPVDQAALDAAAEAQGWAEIPKQFGAIVCMGLPELAPAYGDEPCLRWGEAMAALAKKYGWSFKSIGPELGLALATVPLAVPTYLAVKARRAAAAAPAGETVDGRVTGRATEQQPGAPDKPQKVKPIG
jgi:hypothetical protein